VQQERDALQGALDRFGNRLRRRAQ
jgi:hypothetical protein